MKQQTEMTMDTQNTMDWDDAAMAEWEAGREAAWDDMHEHGGGVPVGTADWVDGWHHGADEYKAWQAGWDDYHAGLHTPRFDPYWPEHEDLWKEGYEAAFLASAE